MLAGNVEACALYGEPHEWPGFDIDLDCSSARGSQRGECASYLFARGIDEQLNTGTERLGHAIADVDRDGSRRGRTSNAVGIEQERTFGVFDTDDVVGAITECEVNVFESNGDFFAIGRARNIEGEVTNKSLAKNVELDINRRERTCLVSDVDHEVLGKALTVYEGDRLGGCGPRVVEDHCGSAVDDHTIDSHNFNPTSC